MHRSASTLRGWVTHGERVLRGEAIAAPGPSPRAADATQRNDVLEILHAARGKISTAELRTQFPEVTRSTLRSLKNRYQRVTRKRRRRGLVTLEWTEPGAVWAMDHTDFGSDGIDGLGRHALIVRDLATGATLLAEPCPQDASRVCAALRRLFMECGAPIALKSDNGSSFIAESTKTLLAVHNVLALFSPPGTPSYNGACEAGVRSIKHRAHAAAAARGAGAVGLDDLHFAREQANAARTENRKIHRQRIEDLRGQAWLRYRDWENRVRSDRGLAPEDALPHAVLASIDRFAVGKALTETRLLMIRRRD